MKTIKERRTHFLIIIIVAFMVVMSVLFIYGQNKWGTILSSVVWSFWLVFGSLLSKRRKRREQLFEAYVKRFDLTPDKLGEVTRFSRYDFSYDFGHQLVFGYGDGQRYEKMLADLETHFGKIDSEEGKK